jgi:hypothetical protein
MRDWIALGIYVAGYLTTARILYVMAEGDGKPEDGAFVGVVFGLVWPLLLAVTLAVLPLMGIGWLISRPTRAARRALVDQRARESAAEYELPYPGPPEVLP